MNQKNPLQTNPFYSFSPSRQTSNPQLNIINQNPFQKAGGPQFLFKDDPSINQNQPQTKPPLIQKGTFTQQYRTINPQQQNPFQRKNNIVQPQLEQPNNKEDESGDGSEQSVSESGSEEENDENKKDQKTEESEDSQQTSEEEEIVEVQKPNIQTKNIATAQILKLKQDEEQKSYKSLAQIQRILKDVTSVNDELDKLDKDLENSLLVSRIRFNDEISQNLSLSQCLTESNQDDDNQSVFSYSKYLLEFDNFNKGGIQKSVANINQINDKKSNKVKKK